MATENNQVVAAGAATTQAVACQLEPGLPFVGELLFPIIQHKALNSLLHWTVKDDMMGARFPVGTVLGVQQVKRREAIEAGGVYLWQYRNTYSLLRITGLQKRGILTQWDKYPDGLDPRTRLHWADKSFALYRVTHYVTYGARTAPPANPTHGATAQELRVEQQLFEGYCAVTLECANRRPLLTTVSAKAALLIRQVLLADNTQQLEKAQAQYDALISEHLLRQARAIVKGGAAL